MPCKRLERGERAASLAHLEFAEELYYEQVKRGCRFVHEQPWTARRWKLECARKLSSTTGVELRRGGQCWFDPSGSQIVTKMRRTRRSISIAFLETIFGESDGTVILDDYFPAHLSGANL